MANNDHNGTVQDTQSLIPITPGQNNNNQNIAHNQKKPNEANQTLVAAGAVLAAVGIVMAIAGAMFLGPAGLALGAVALAGVAVIAGATIGPDIAVRFQKLLGGKNGKSEGLSVAPVGLQNYPNLSEPGNNSLDNTDKNLTSKSPTKQFAELVSETGISPLFGAELAKKTQFFNMTEEQQSQFVADFKSKMDELNPDGKKVSSKGEKSLIRDAAADIARVLQPDDIGIQQWADGRNSKAIDRDIKKDKTKGIAIDTERLNDASPEALKRLGIDTKEIGAKLKENNMKGGEDVTPGKLASPTFGAESKNALEMLDSKQQAGKV